MEPTEMTEALERYEQALEALRPSFEALREAITQAWLTLMEQLRPLLTALLEWWEEIRREALYRRLRRWCVLHCLAHFLARRWPERWLPWLESVD